MMDQTAPTEYLLFDLNGQKVAVTDVVVDDKGLRSNWVILGDRRFKDEDIEMMLAKAFRDLIDQMETPVELVEEIKPDPVAEKQIDQPKPSRWARLVSKVREFL